MNVHVRSFNLSVARVWRRVEGRDGTVRGCEGARHSRRDKVLAGAKTCREVADFCRTLTVHTADWNLEIWRLEIDGGFRIRDPRGAMEHITTIFYGCYAPGGDLADSEF